MDEMTQPSGSAGNQGGVSDTASAVAGAAQSSAGSVASSVGEHAGDVKDSVTEQVGVIAQDAKTHATRLFDSSKEELRSQSDAQATKVAEGLRTLCSELGSMADATSQPGPLADVTREASQRITAFAERLDGEGLQAVTGDLSSMARRRPGTFLLGALAAGFVAGRLLRTTQTVMSEDSGPGAAGVQPNGQVSAAPGAAFPQVTQPTVAPEPTLPSALPPITTIPEPSGAGGAGTGSTGAL